MTQRMIPTQGCAITILLLLLLTSAFSLCTERSNTVEEQTDDDAEDDDIVDDDLPAGSPAKISAANDHFSFDLYDELRNDPQWKDKNVFFSPYSIEFALAMTREGAKGKTAAEMDDVLHLPSNDSDRRTGFSALYDSVNTDQPGCEVSTANALWPAQAIPMKDAYKTTIKDYYHGGATNLDYANDAEGSRQTINHWVENKTNDKIKDLIPPDFIGPMTAFVITNAVYFNGTWLTQFDKKNTTEHDFETYDGRAVKTPFMKLVSEDVEFNYSETKDFQALELPYTGNSVTMTILLPKEKGLKDVESALDQEVLDEIAGSMNKTNVDVYLPRFKMETKYFMAKTLEEMGMPTAFNGSIADFSNMSDEPISISEVIHQTYLDVNEEGTEAAAATAVIGNYTCAPSTPFFCADHAFLFLIQDKDTGTILFMGRLADPTQK